MTPDQRLLVLAEALEEDANNPKGLKFDLNTWLEGPERPFWKPFGQVPEPSRSCGTVGCAVGLAMLLPKLQADGLVWNRDKRDCVPAFEFDTHWVAVRKFFGLVENEDHWLFNSFSYAEDEQQGAKAELAVAVRIREFVAKRRRYTVPTNPASPSRCCSLTSDT